MCKFVVDDSPSVIIVIDYHELGTGSSCNLNLFSLLMVFTLVQQEAFVLCRVFQKSGSGPKNGEQYGAPFMEEEWLDDELDLVPKAEAAEEVDFGDDLYLDGDDLEQVCTHY